MGQVCACPAISICRLNEETEDVLYSVLQVRRGSRKRVEYMRIRLDFVDSVFSSSTDLQLRSVVWL